MTEERRRLEAIANELLSKGTPVDIDMMLKAMELAQGEKNRVEAQMIWLAWLKGLWGKRKK